MAQQDRHNSLTALLAQIDQQIADAEAFTVAECDDEVLMRATEVLADLREARERTEE